MELVDSGSLSAGGSSATTSNYWASSGLMTERCVSFYHFTAQLQNTHAKTHVLRSTEMLTYQTDVSLKTWRFTNNKLRAWNYTHCQKQVCCRVYCGGKGTIRFSPVTAPPTGGETHPCAHRTAVSYKILCLCNKIETSIWCVYKQRNRNSSCV